MSERKLLPAEKQFDHEAAHVLARAFVDNPSVLAILDRSDQDERFRLMERGYRQFVRASRRYADASVVLDGGRVAGVALAYLPSQYPPALAAMGLIAIGPLLAGPRYALRFASIDAYMRKQHHKGPHYYLFVLGVDPDFQGQGIGSMLVRRLSELADRDGLPCYLETDKESNVRLYERHGYRVTVHEKLAKLQDLPFWTMTRPPAGV